MREIKFRAWLKDKRLMVEWSPLFFSDMSPVTGYASEFPSDENTILMQYTGLRDKNGREIYEGDVVRKFTSGLAEHIKRYQMHPLRWAYVVVYENCCFGFVGAIARLHHPDDMKLCPFYNIDDEEMEDLEDAEIIGNIHENPELIHPDNQSEGNSTSQEAHGG